VTTARFSMAVFAQSMTLARSVIWVLLGLAVSTCVTCTRRPVDHAMLDGELLQSVRKGDTATVLHLLQQGADIDAKDQGGSTALALAADYGHRDVARLLLDRGADPVAGGLSGESALTEAAGLGYATKVALVLERGGDLSTKNEALFAMGESGPAVIQVQAAPTRQVQEQPNQVLPDIDIARTVGLLLDHGANVESRNYDEATPLMWAAEHGSTEVVRALLGRGADVEARDKYGGTALIRAACECAIIDMPETLESMRLLLEKGANVNARDTDGGTALMAAASAGRTQNMTLLLDNGAQIELKDKDGNTALLVSAGAGPYSAVGVVYTVDPVKLLLERGANLEVTNSRGDTALMLAASKGGYEDEQTVRLLLDNGAAVEAKNRQGKTALELALKQHRTDTVHLLRNTRRAPK
jgi:ankyrin repeat protein